MPLPEKRLKNRYGKNTEIIRNDLSIRPQSTSGVHFITGQRLTLQETDLVRHHEVILGYILLRIAFEIRGQPVNANFLVACCPLAEPCSMHALRGTYLFLINMTSFTRSSSSSLRKKSMSSSRNRRFKISINSSFFIFPYPPELCMFLKVFQQDLK